MNKLLKKILIAAMLFCMIFAVSGCKSDDYVEVSADDFILTIEADKQAYKYGEKIYINFTFENHSGANIKVAVYGLFYPHSDTANFPACEQAPASIRTFKKDEIIHDTYRVDDSFFVGQHELKYSAVFYLSWQKTEMGYLTTDNRIEVWSNSIEFSIIDS